MSKEIKGEEFPPLWEGKLAKMYWIKEVIDELYQALNEDMRLIADLCGFDVLLSLIQNFAGMSLYISERPLYKAMEAYIYKNYDGTNVKELATRLGVSERFIYKVIAQKRQK